jgi:hypothetical protein
MIHLLTVLSERFERIVLFRQDRSMGKILSLKKYLLVKKNQGHMFTQIIRGAGTLNDLEGSDHWPITLELS